MAQTYTLEEAASRLGITPDEMKRRLKEEWKTLRSFRDGPTLRFRAADVDELARSLGAASDPGLQLAPIPAPPEHGSDDFKIPTSGSPPHAARPPADEPLVFGGSSDDDVFSLSVEDSKVEPAMPKTGSDSDVRLEAAGSDKPRERKKDKSDIQAVVPTEELSLDVSGPGSAVIKGGSSAKLSAPKSSPKIKSGDSGKSLANPGAGESSEFELSLDADSSDFELQLNTESSDEVNLGALPTDKDKAGKSGGASGINLRDPADSGISLEKKGAAADSDVDFELSLEPAAKSGPKPGARPGKVPDTSESDSEFELTLDDSGEGSSLEAAALESQEGKKDIFETDFEIPPMSDESGSEAVAVESDTDLERSDFELALNDSDVVSEEDETGSQVVLLEEDEATPAGRTRRGAAGVEVETGDVDLADVEVEEEADAATALKGARGRRRPAEDEEEDEEEAAVPAGAAAPASWGVVPLLGLVPGFFVVLLGVLMSFELIHTMWGYQQPTRPATPIVRGVASALDMDVKDQ
jgi:hypothetical protein